MTLARANSTNVAKLRWLERMKDPDYVPQRFEPTAKADGSKILSFGEWVEVKKE